MPWPSWPAATWRTANSPRRGGVRPQLLVTVDLDSLLSHPDGLGGETGGPWPLDPETCRRLACDAAVTRVLVTRHRTHHHDGSDGEASLAGWLQTAATRLPPTLGGAPTQPLEVGRTSRVVTPAQRTALMSATAAVRWPAATDPRPGAKPTICAIGCMAAPPTWTTWPCCAGPTIARSTRAAGGWPAAPTGG